MGSIAGVKRKVALVGHATINTITAAGAGTLLANDGVTTSKNQTALTSTPIGSGNIMLNDSDIGDYAPSADFSIDAKPAGVLASLLGGFCQSELVPVLQSGSTYAHSFIPQLDSVTGYLALVKQEDGTNVQELYNGKVTNLGFTANANDFLKCSSNILFGERRMTGQAGVVNTVATMANVAAIASNSPFVTRSVHEFLINAQGGAALSNGTDLVSVTDLQFEYETPHELVAEIRGAAGNGAPERTDGLSFVVTAIFKDTSEASYVYTTAMENGTEFKASFTCVSGTNKVFLIFPRLKVIEDPSAPLSSTGRNPVTVKFTGMQAATAPTGMGSTVPYFVLHNTVSTKTWVG